VSRERGIDLSVLAAAPGLKRGDRHPAVEEAQRLLEHYGYLPRGEAETGLIDNPTSEALSAYERFHSLPETGDFDPAVRDLMRYPRCGLPDLNNGIAFALQTPLHHLELTFAFGQGTADLEGDLEFGAVKRAFGTWATTDHFAFYEVEGDAQHDFMVSWSTSAHDFPMGELANATLPTEEPHQRILFNDPGYNWALHNSFIYAVDVESVALHEIGHLLGLDHSNVPDSVMWPSQPIDGSLRRKLYRDDLNAIDALYGGLPARLASAIIFASRQHFGDDPESLPGDFVGVSHDYTFDVPGLGVGKPAYLLFQASSVAHENVFTLNGQPIVGGLPITTGEGWAGQVMLISPHVLKPARNVLHVEASLQGDTDDFVLDNAVVLYTPITPGLFLIHQTWPEADLGFTPVVPPLAPV
jgi:Matrixin/Putative peptidoglycan binding domain